MSQEHLIAELQQQLAFQEQTIDSLNDTVTQQQLDIARLQRTVELLAQQMKNVREDLSNGQEAPPADQKPPHY
jgi:SlyX protein